MIKQVIISGRPMFVDLKTRMGRVLASGKIYEKQEVKLITTWLNRIQDPLFIDVGAHFGYYSTLAANLGAEVYAFEPALPSFNVLVRNQNLYAGKKFYIYHMAIGDIKANMNIWFNKTNDGDHRVYEIPNEKRLFQPVKVDSLDSILKNPAVMIGFRWGFEK